MTKSIFLTFLNWFFLKAPLEIFQIGKNFTLWGWKFFSIGYFVPRLFSPWHRDITSYGRGFDLKRFLHSLGWNLISRLLGAVLRLLVMLAGLIIEALLIATTVLVLAGWFLLPIIIPGLIIIGIVSLFI